MENLDSEESKIQMLPWFTTKSFFGRNITEEHIRNYLINFITIAKVYKLKYKKFGISNLFDLTLP
jgi:hypothetical protein